MSNLFHRMCRLSLCSRSEMCCVWWVVFMCVKWDEWFSGLPSYVMERMAEWCGLPPEVRQRSVSVDCSTHGWSTDPSKAKVGSFSDLQPRLANHPAILHLNSVRGLRVSIAPFLWLSIMTVTPHYKDIMRFHTGLCWLGMVDLICLFFVSLSPSVGSCVCLLPCHSETNYFRGRARLCGRAAIHVWQTASTNLHSLWFALAKHHLVLAALSSRRRSERVSHASLPPEHDSSIKIFWFLSFILSLSDRSTITHKTMYNKRGTHPLYNYTKIYSLIYLSPFHNVQNKNNNKGCHTFSFFCEDILKVISITQIFNGLVLQAM